MISRAARTPQRGYAAASLQAHVRGAQDQESALHMDVVLMQVLSHEHEDIRRQGVLGLGVETVRAAAVACVLAGKHLSAAQLSYAAIAGWGSSAGADLRRASEALQRLEEAGAGCSVSRILEGRVGSAAWLLQATRR